MAPNSKPSNEFVLSFVDELNHHSNLDDTHDCPEALKPVLVMINRTRLGHEDLHPQLEEQTFKACHVYDKQLMWRAEQMARACSGIGMNKKSELEWQSVMSPHVFLSLNNKDEERTNSERQYHHCLACCRVFRPGSRPVLNGSSNTTPQSNVESTLKTAAGSEICDSDIHFNLPNSVLQPQLRFRFQEENRQRHGVPDATIGLCAYDLKNEPWRKQRPDLRTNPRIELFSLRFLSTIFEKYEDLKGPYPSQVLDGGVPVFAFALWEAKKSDGDSHWKAFTQLDKKVRSLLRWQDSIINEAEIYNKEFFSVVWAFTSVGSSWTVYGCYRSIYGEHGQHFGSSVEIWSGNVSDKNKALQLLWIVDIIKFWAEYTYKPMIGACLARLKSPTDEPAEVPLEETLWNYHIVLDRETTPWFFHQANYPPGKKGQILNVLCGNDRPKLKSKNSSDQCSPCSSETAPNQILHRRPTLNEQQIDDFTWLQDRDPSHGDLLVVRLGREGKIDKPLILLEYSNSDHSARYSGKLPSHAGVDVGLMWGKGGVHLLRQQREFFSSDHQFCAILPLKPKVYQGQRRKARESSIFEPLEELLDLDGFYRIYDLEYTSDGDRRGPQVEDHSNITIDDGDAAESDQGTYDEVTSDDEADIRSDADGSSDDVEEEEEEEGESTVNDHEEFTSDEDELDTPEKSHQRLDSVHKAWKSHQWPKSATQGKAFARIAIRLDLARTIAYKVKDIKMYSGDEKLLIDWMTPVKGFGKSFLRVQTTEKQDSPTSESSDNQSYEGSDPDQTLVDSGDMGKEAISELGKKFDFLKVK